MSAVPLSSTSVPWQAQFLAVLPAIRTHAKIHFRKLPPERREEAIEETIASACASFQLLASQGKLDRVPASALATYAVKAVKSGRRVGGHQNSSDVLSELTQQKHGLRVQNLATAPDDQEPWQAAVMESRRVSPSDLAAFRVDFKEWLKSFSRRHRRIITTLAGGERAATVADRFGLSPGRVSQLRRWYERGWRVFQGEALLDTPGAN
jgi:hypothetical protein